MATFVFAYRMRTDYARRGDEALGTWMAWFDSLGASLSDPGNPVFEAAEVGNCGEGTQLGGYSFVTADDLEEAMTLAKGSPALEAGGGVEVGVVTELHPGTSGVRPARG